MMRCFFATVMLLQNMVINNFSFSRQKIYRLVFQKKYADTSFSK